MPDPARTPSTATAPPALPTDVHLAAIARAAGRLADAATDAGWAAPVPTCPRWTAAHLVAHQGMVHRWAEGHLRRDPAPVPSQTTILRTVPRAELRAWFVAGVEALLETFRVTPSDADALVFLNDAPPPRAFWARRQAHETTVHAVDALAARLQRLPTATEAAIDPDLAADGIDELLRGFFTRGRSRLASGEPFTIAVRPDDAARAWLVRVGTERLTTEHLTTEHLTTEHLTSDRPTSDRPTSSVAPDVVFAGSAAQLYLGLWNRGDEIRASGRAEVLARWHEVQRVGWS